MTRLRNVLLDRDGTVIEDRHYLSDPAGVELIHGVGRALGRLNEAGMRLFLVTNQSGIGRGMFDVDAYRACNARLAELLVPFGAAFEAEAFCPHAPDERCLCRKPAPGQWERLSVQFDLDPAQTVMIGDKVSDVQFGLRCGLAASILVRTGKGRDSAASLGLDYTQHPVFELGRREADWPHVMAWDVAAAAQWILRNAENR